MQHNITIHNLFANSREAIGFAEGVLSVWQQAHPEAVWTAYSYVRKALAEFDIDVDSSTEDTDINALKNALSQLLAAQRGAATALNEVLEEESDD